MNDIDREHPGTSCSHHVDFDKLRSQKRPGGRFRLVADCDKCGTSISLDTVLTTIIDLIGSTASTLADLADHTGRKDIAP